MTLGRVGDENHTGISMLASIGVGSKIYERLMVLCRRLLLILSRKFQRLRHSGLMFVIFACCLHTFVNALATTSILRSSRKPHLWWYHGEISVQIGKSWNRARTLDIHFHHRIRLILTRFGLRTLIKHRITKSQDSGIVLDTARITFLERMKDSSAFQHIGEPKPHTTTLSLAVVVSSRFLRLGAGV